MRTTIQTILKALKYILIALLNAILLFYLMSYSFDDLAYIFDSHINDILNILLVTILSIIGMRILVAYFRRKKIGSVRTKIIASIVLTLLVSAFLYVNFSYHLVHNKILNRTFRSALNRKLELVKEGRFGELTKIACILTNREYQEISQNDFLPKLPIVATNISLTYEFDSFLGDYSVHMKYDVPLNVEVKSIEKEGGDWRENQSFEPLGNIKRVSYAYVKM